jgi:hypothetical protein
MSLLAELRDDLGKKTMLNCVTLRPRLPLKQIR